MQIAKLSDVGVINQDVLQWNLDLRKILGVKKSILNRYSFLFQTQENLWKSITLQTEHLKQYKCLIALTLSNASDYICRYSYPLLGKYENICFLKLENLMFFFKLLWNCQKVPIF